MKQGHGSNPVAFGVPSFEFRQRQNSKGGDIYVVQIWDKVVGHEKSTCDLAISRA